MARSASLCAVLLHVALAGAVSEVAYRRVTINGQRCDTGMGAELCASQYCSAATTKLERVKCAKGGVDQYNACERCFAIRCESEGAGSSYCTGQTLRDSCKRPKPKKTDKIAVVGAGVHGLLLARRLKKDGYKHVTLYEKEAAVAGITDTFAADGYNFDQATKFIPADTTTYAGVPEEMQEMFTEYGFALRPLVSTTFYDTDTETTLPAPKVLLPYLATPAGQQQLAGNMIAGFELMKTIRAAAKTPAQMIEAGFILKNETWEAFSARINLPAFTEYLELVADSFLNGPVRNQPAAVVLNHRISFMPSYIKALLLAMGITSTSPLPLSDELRAVLAGSPGTSYVLEGGYSAFFDALVAHEELDVRLSSEVKSLRYTSKGVAVKVAGKPAAMYDHVVVASRPKDSVKFMPNLPAKKLLTSASATDPVEVFFFRTEASHPVLGGAYTAFAYPASDTFAPGTLSAFQKEHADSTVLAALGYADPTTTEEEAIANARVTLDGYGTPVTDLLAYRRYDYASVVPAVEVEQDWFPSMETAQGQRNTYFVGEVFSGIGVPTAVVHVNSFADRFF